MATEYLNNKALEKGIAEFQESKKAKVKYRLIIEDIQEAIIRKNKRKRLTTKELKLLEEAKRSYCEADNDFFVAQQLLTGYFYILSENLVKYKKFNFIDPDDALQEGVVICFEKVDRFIPHKGRAFNYMTTCVINHFRQLYRTARNYNELKKKYHDYQQIKMNKTIIKNGKEIPVFRSI